MPGLLKHEQPTIRIADGLDTGPPMSGFQLANALDHLGRINVDARWNIQVDKCFGRTIVTDLSDEQIGTTPAGGIELARQMIGLIGQMKPERLPEGDRSAPVVSLDIYVSDPTSHSFLLIL